MDRQPKIQSSSVEETLQRIMEQTNNDCRFRISTLTSSLRQQLLLAGGFTTLQLVQEVQKFMNKMGEPDHFQGRIIFMSMLNDIICVIIDNETECITNSKIVCVFICKKIFQQEDGHSSDVDQKQSGILPMIANHKENGSESLN